MTLHRVHTAITCTGYLNPVAAITCIVALPSPLLVNPCTPTMYIHVYAVPKCVRNPIQSPHCPTDAVLSSPPIAQPMQFYPVPPLPNRCSSIQSPHCPTDAVLSSPPIAQPMRFYPVPPLPNRCSSIQSPHWSIHAFPALIGPSMQFYPALNSYCVHAKWALIRTCIT